MCAKSSPMGTPPSERSRSATEKAARGDSTCCARGRRQLAGESRKNRQRGIAIAPILPDVASGRVGGVGLVGPVGKDVDPPDLPVPPALPDQPNRPAPNVT